MKNYSIIFVLSFISYFMVLFAVPYISAQNWANRCFEFFLLSVVYQLFYISLLRKKDKVSFGRSVSNFFLCSFVIGSLYVTIQYINIFVNGYSIRKIFTGEIVATYYGLDAWQNCVIENIIYLPFLLITLIYVVMYFIVSRKIKSR